jgi:hypothetical protein
VLKLAVLALAAASTTSTPALQSSAPWWEKVTVMVAPDGEPKSCSYVSSLKPQAPTACEVSGDSPDATAGPSGSKDQYTRITFERRFNPGGRPDAEVAAGDTLLGSQILALAIDQAGAVKGCQIVSKSGTLTPDYGCDEAKAERFEASVSRGADQSFQGFMTILVYGHDEHVV